MLNKKIVLFISVFTSAVVSADEVVKGIDFEKVDWPLLCSRVGGVVFEQNNQYCEVSHSASQLHNSRVIERFLNQSPNFDVCAHLKNEYEYLTTPKEELAEPWALCRQTFKASLTSRDSNKESYLHSLSDWKQAHFNSQTMRK
jgi:hypothetical protein